MLSYKFIYRYYCLICFLIFNYRLFVCVCACARACECLILRRKLLLCMYFTRRAQKHGVFRLISEIILYAWPLITVIQVSATIPSY